MKILPLIVRSTRSHTFHSWTPPLIQPLPRMTRASSRWGHLVGSRASWGSLCPAAACLWAPGSGPAALPRRAHCVQSQTPHYRSDAAKLEAVQRGAGEHVGRWGPRWRWWREGSSRPALAVKLAQQDPAGNLRNASSVRQRLETQPPSH
jgi:hypothetical protein